MMILTKQQYDDMIKHSLENLPNEACGLLGGVIEGEQRIVKQVYFIENIDHSPEHFSMDPKEQFAVLKDIRNKGWSLLGNYHSHPESPSRPSEEDKRLAFDPEASYLILSLMDNNNPVLKSFTISKETVEEEQIKVVLGE